MAALPYIQLYIADYLADTMHLSTEEHGAYLLLIFNYWQTGKPISKSRLRAIARVDTDRWPDIEETLSEFFEDDGERWTHSRIEDDLLNIATNPRGKPLPNGDSLSGYKGYVYFIGSDDSDLVKVGYSKNPWARLNELRRDYGGELRVLATVKTVDRSESSVHKFLTDYHDHGEWFRKSAVILGLIRLISEKKVSTVGEIESTVVELRSSTTTTTNTDKDKDRNTEGEQSPSADPPAKIPNCPHETLVNLYHEVLPTLRPVRELNDTRRGYMRSIWKQRPTLDWWREYFQWVSQSDFLCGRVDGRDDKPPFVADLEWITKPSNFVKITEGKYHPRGGA